MEGQDDTPREQISWGAANGALGALSPSTSYFEMTSVHVGDRFAIWVTLPPRYGRKVGGRHSVIYMTDGNTNALLAAAAGFLVLGDHLRPMRQFVQVCIGYADGTTGDRLARRNRDFLPPGEPFSPIQERHVRARPYADILGEGGMAAFLHHARNGRADLFLRFIEEELHPEIASRFAIDPRDASLYGHSQGGLFALYAMVRGSPLFRTFGAGSPGFMVENSVVLDLFRERRRLRTARDAPIRLHMTANDLEMTGDIAMYRTISRGLLDFIEILKEEPWAGLEITYEIIRGETHFSGVFDGYRSFLRACYRQ
jgi:predicted alpha/beta superfamily hydrolase